MEKFVEKIKIRGIRFLFCETLNCSFEWETWRTKLRIARYKIGQLLFETRKRIFIRKICWS